MKTPEEIKKAVSLCVLQESSCMNDCPYFKYLECRDILCADALAYIEQLKSRAEPKNRVLTLEEVEAYCEGGADATPLWYEDKDNGDVSRWMVIDLPELAFGSTATVKRLMNSQFFEPAYGKNWRCWLRKPTAEEMEETSWNGGAEE